MTVGLLGVLLIVLPFTFDLGTDCTGGGADQAAACFVGSVFYWILVSGLMLMALFFGAIALLVGGVVAGIGAALRKKNGSNTNDQTWVTGDFEYRRSPDGHVQRRRIR